MDHPRILLKAVAPENVQIYKDVRLRALQDSPLAFGATFAKESQMTGDEWMHRATQCHDGHCIRYLAFSGEMPCGLIGCFLHPDDCTKADLVSMWVDPRFRSDGVGRLLVDSVRNWARDHHVRHLRLTVVSTNAGAIAFYHRNGFALTGNTEPYPNDPDLHECEMAQILE